jgi:hypothetical protein
MTTYYQFQPSENEAFNFQPTLDGAVYTIIVGWSLFGQRYYVQCYTNSNTLVFNVPLIGSQDGIHIQSASWLNGVVTMTCDVPHNFIVGSTVNATLRGFVPEQYNGGHQVFVTSNTTFTFPLSNNPGSPASLGYVDYNINLSAGYFTRSTLVYRQSNQTFEVNP